MDPGLPPNAANGAQQQQNGNLAADVANNNNRVNRHIGHPRNQLLSIRDRLFHALFHRIAIGYATAIPAPVRRFIEMALLIKV